MLILLGQIAIFGVINIILFTRLGKLFTKLEDKVWTSLLLGYVFVSILFNIWIKLIGYSGQLTVVWMYLLAFLIGIVFSLKHLKKDTQEIFKSLWVVILLLFFMSIFQSNSSLQSNSSNNNYWHSANADIFDGLCGAQTLLSEGSAINATQTELGDAETRTNAKELLPYLSLNGDSLCSGNQKVYLEAKESMQYTNIALFAELLGLPASMYVFLFQSSLNLLLFFNMLVLFGKRIFAFGNTTASIFASISVFSHLYFITFVNGHIGSMMVQAPLVLLISLITTDRQSVMRNLFLAFILTLFIGLSYPYILPFIVIYSLIWIIGITFKSRPKSQQLVTMLLILMFSLACWVTFSAQREKVRWAERSWGTFLNPLGPLQYIGVLPGNINGSGLLGYSQQRLIKFGITSSLEFWVVSISLTLFILGNIIIVSRNSNIKLPNKLLFCSLAFPLIIGLTSRDSYYTYKVSYIFQFVLIGYLTLRMHQLSRGVKLRKGIVHLLPSLLTQCLLIIFLALNLFWNVGATYGVVASNNQWKSISNSINALETSDVKNAILQTDSYQVSNIANFTVQKIRSRDPESLVTPLSMLSIVAENNKYLPKVTKVPADSLWLSGLGISGIESDTKGKFRWVYEYLTKPKSSYSEYYSVRVLRLNSTKENIISSFCLSLPEWDLRKIASVEIVDQKLNLLVKFDFTKEISCKSFEIPGNTSILKIRTNLSGAAPSLFDTRRFLFRIWDTGKDNQIYNTLG